MSSREETIQDASKRGDEDAMATSQEHTEGTASTGMQLEMVDSGDDVNGSMSVPGVEHSTPHLRPVGMEG